MNGYDRRALRWELTQVGNHFATAGSSLIGVVYQEARTGKFCIRQHRPCYTLLPERFESAEEGRAHLEYLYLVGLLSLKDFP